MASQERGGKIERHRKNKRGGDSTTNQRNTDGGAMIEEVMHQPTRMSKERKVAQQERGGAQWDKRGDNLTTSRRRWQKYERGGNATTNQHKRGAVR